MNVAPEPALAVVVATRNRAHLLPRLLDALAAQCDAPPFEVVIVDDASNDETPDVLARRGGHDPYALRTIRLQQRSGPAAARNRGWESSSAPVVAFTDDDCVPQATWIASLLAGLKTADVVQGQTVGHPEQQPSGPFSWSPGATSERGFFETCNIAYRRTTLAAVHGFDRVFQPQHHARDAPPVWGEDTDLALRAKSNGARTAFAADALVWHDLKPGDLAARLADIPRREGTVLLVKRHPDVRDRFASRCFLDPAHGWLLLAAGGLVFALVAPHRRLRWTLAVAAAAPWARARGRGTPLRRWPSLLAQWLVVDAVEVSTLARASVRYRTLFL